MSNSFKLFPTHFSKGANKFLGWAKPTLRPLWIQAWVGAMQTCYRVEQCFSTRVMRNLRVPWVVASDPAETDRNCLGRNSQPQFYAIVAIWTLGSLHRLPWATQQVHIAVVDIRQCHRFHQAKSCKGSSAIKMPAQVRSYVNQTELASELNLQCNYFTLVEKTFVRRRTGLVETAWMKWLVFSLSITTSAECSCIKNAWAHDQLSSWLIMQYTKNRLYKRAAYASAQSSPKSNFIVDLCTNPNI